MRIIHNPEIDYVSIDFREGVESKSHYENGVILRFDSKGNVLGIDITDSSKFFSGTDDLDLKAACKLLGISESTMRRRIREGSIKFSKANKKDYRFKRKDLLKAS